MVRAKIVVSMPMPGVYHAKVYRDGNRIEGVFHVSAEEDPAGGYTVFVGFLDRMLDYSFHADEVESVRDWEARDAAMVVVEGPTHDSSVIASAPSKSLKVVDVTKLRSP